MRSIKVYNNAYDGLLDDLKRLPTNLTEVGVARSEVYDFGWILITKLKNLDVYDSGLSDISGLG